MERYKALNHFLATADMADEEVKLLKDQYSIMAEYLHILDRRILRWTK